VSNFAPLEDKISSKADEFTIKHDGKPTDGAAESYTITARPNNDVQVKVTVSRTADAPGWKLGNKRGRSFFGPNVDSPKGYVVHRFWPRTHASGMVVYKGKAIEIDGPGMLVHAIQGMRLDLVASRWNFAHFQSDAHGGVSAIQMEFTTVKAFGLTGEGSGNVKVNIGSIVVGGKLVTVTGETHLPGEAETDGAVVSRATHLAPQKDSHTTYMAPSGIRFQWRGPSLVQPGESVGAQLDLDIGPPNAMNGLIDKVDVLAEIPGPIKALLRAAVGVKPYIYQWVLPSKLTLRGKNIVPGIDAEEVVVEGWTNSEASFISE